MLILLIDNEVRLSKRLCTFEGVLEVYLLVQLLRTLNTVCLTEERFHSKTVFSEGHSIETNSNKRFPWLHINC